MNRTYLIIAAIISVLLFLVLHKIISLNDSELANRFTITGTIISFVGLLYAIYQLQRISSANEAAQNAIRDTKHHFNFNEVVDLSSSIMGLCKATIQCINNQTYQSAAENMRQIRENIIYINSGIEIIKVREELKDTEDFKKYLNDININLSDLQQENITRFTSNGICQQLDKILQDATEINLIKKLL